MRFRLTLTPYFISFVFCFSTFISCKKTLEEERTYSEIKSIESYIQSKKWNSTNSNGIYHVVRESSYGYRISEGDTVSFYYKGYTLNGKVFDTNIKSEAILAKLDTNVRSLKPIITIAGSGNLISGLDKGLLLLNDKEKATLLFTSSQGYGSNILGPINQWSPVAFDIEILKVNSINIQKENSFIANLNLIGNGFTKDISGLYYKFLLLGVDSKPSVNDTIWGWFKGSLPDGTVIEDVGTGNTQIILSSESIPEGVRLGFLLTQKGGITDLVSPSYLGFGNKGSGIIKPYQTLIYKIRLDSIK